VDRCVVCERGPGPLCSWECRRTAVRLIDANVQLIRKLAGQDATDLRRRLALENGRLQSAAWRFDTRPQEPA
jgi:hypothetical protein